MAHAEAPHVHSEEDVENAAIAAYKAVVTAFVLRSKAINQGSTAGEHAVLAGLCHELEISADKEAEILEELKETLDVTAWQAGTEEMDHKGGDFLTDGVPPAHEAAAAGREKKKRGRPPKSQAQGSRSSAHKEAVLKATGGASNGLSSGAKKRGRPPKQSAKKTEDAGMVEVAEGPKLRKSRASEEEPKKKGRGRPKKVAEQRNEPGHAGSRSPAFPEAAAVTWLLQKPFNNAIYNGEVVGYLRKEKFYKRCCGTSSSPFLCGAVKEFPLSAPTGGLL